MSRDAFLYWWPVAARALGVLGAFMQAAYAVATRQGADVAFLGFCGALVAAPTIFPADPLPRKGRNGENETSP